MYWTYIIYSIYMYERLMTPTINISQKIDQLPSLLEPQAISAMEDWRGALALLAELQEPFFLRGCEWGCYCW